MRKKRWSQDDGGRLSRRWVGFVPLWVGAALAGAVSGSGWIGALPADAATTSIRANFGTCYTGGGTNCVVDGDTLWLGGQKIRVADIDAPETHGPRCAAEEALGNRATRRLRELLNGGAVSLQAIDRDIDRYGRKLRIVLVDGRSVGDTLVDEGLARPYAGGRRPWC
ncbi:MAG: thermonuclease family protein [Sphingomicrobium sp.]